MAEKREEDSDAQGWQKVVSVEQFRRAAVTVVLTLQVTLMVITLRYSKTSTHYLNGTAVLLAEGLKMAICLSVLAWQHGGRLGDHLMQELAGKPKDLVLVSMPALLYLLQNNLLFFAMEHLEAVIYQVTYQLKILTTAICMVLMLGKRLTGQQWAALLLLASGVALAQGGSEGEAGSGATARASPKQAHAQLIGFIALIVACFTSGFAGVYTERLLKQSGVSLWLRNVQLGIWSLVVGAVALYFGEGSEIRERGFFAGYTWVVWCVVLLQAASGILVALVIKLADNIIKSFSAAMSLLISTLVSIPVFGFQPNRYFAAGACLVLLSAHLYSGGSLPCLGEGRGGPQEKSQREAEKLGKALQLIDGSSEKAVMRFSVISDKV
uniref:UDP-galactose transporter n=1 Tax=Alexandrium catenella TaxID=2925 RepID=A0A7S1RBL0_ALECA|mmetsp:Transcript_51219/g.136954  ORF Transcript_51219/g.136954 Transcript_51219/m.136954 type:complete len:381 (+) Transcript_51219:114-1256(+)|eukprot:CAMPEP_0171198540 /NCGR_PEP_ID=MMETSP0790-20130122/22994_1 /TAXON_ID=2925 /ORGANISM="Alexandrium catenella, Strain OF101" /LENGTH=380 /DNA_ID=CAMNT_0011663845 /DNA_START=114 /DNA_END=1256 /DNA_ORIENTATION=-